MEHCDILEGVGIESCQSHDPSPALSYDTVLNSYSLDFLSWSTINAMELPTNIYEYYISGFSAMHFSFESLPLISPLALS